ncbi:MAG: hypothetical protein AUJ51_03230 [Elusimicrobia bacterium CG1_02_56_21]|nr:MAG: hypothetical protein AUJ51_03230 [Elusimicrobia bacterium CG1_02_56_21]
MKKNIILKLIAVAAILSCGGLVQASDFGLESLSAADIRSGQSYLKASDPRAEPDELIGVEMKVRVPFKALKKIFLMASVSDSSLSIIDPAAQVIGKSGEMLRISNINVDQGGIIMTPVVTLKPSMDGRDKLVFRVNKIKVHASMEPSLKGIPEPPIDQEELIGRIMDVVVKCIYTGINEKLKAKQVPLKAEDFLTIKYDKAAWALRVTVSHRLINEFFPAGLVGDFHLTGFSFNETGINLNVQTAE